MSLKDKAKFPCINAKTTMKIKRLERERMFYRIIAFTNVALFIVIFTEGILNHTSHAILAFTVAFYILFIGIIAQQHTNTIKWALWYHKNRHLIKRYHEKFGEIKQEEIKIDH